MWATSSVRASVGRRRTGAAAVRRRAPNPAEPAGVGTRYRAAREPLIRAGFSALAAAVTLYMCAEYLDRFARVRRAPSLVVGVACAALAVLEAWKVGVRVEQALGLR